jgi:hypothetical protein
MKTTKLMVVIAMILLAFTTAYSQTQHGRFDAKGKVNDRIDKMDAVVKFTGNQRTEVQALFDDVVKMKKDAFCTNEMGSDGMQKAMKSIRKEKDTRLKKILTNDQMTLWKNYNKENKTSHTHKKGGNEKGGKSIDDRINTKLDKMNEVVKFTGNQRADLKTLFTDLAKRGKDAICANEIGSDELKTSMKLLNQERKDSMKKILTEDQLKLWQDFKKSKHEDRKKERDSNKGSDSKEK